MLWAIKMHDEVNLFMNHCWLYRNFFHNWTIYVEAVGFLSSCFFEMCLHISASIFVSHKILITSTILIQEISTMFFLPGCSAEVWFCVHNMLVLTDENVHAGVTCEQWFWGHCVKVLESYRHASPWAVIWCHVLFCSFENVKNL